MYVWGETNKWIEWENERTNHLARFFFLFLYLYWSTTVSLLRNILFVIAFCLVNGYHKGVPIDNEESILQKVNLWTRRNEQKTLCKKKKILIVMKVNMNMNSNLDGEENEERKKKTNEKHYTFRSKWLKNVPTLHI